VRSTVRRRRHGGGDAGGGEADAGGRGRPALRISNPFKTLLVEIMRSRGGAAQTTDAAVVLLNPYG
jgi:hypothetical protein